MISLDQIKRKVLGETPFLGNITSSLPNLSQYMNVSERMNQFKDTIISKPRALYRNGAEFADGWIKVPKTYASNLSNYICSFFSSFGEFVSAVFFSKETRDFRAARAQSVITKQENDEYYAQVKNLYNNFGANSKDAVKEMKEKKKN